MNNENKNKITRFIAKRGTGIGMILILLVLGLRSPLFFAPQNLADVLKQSGILTMIALGLNFVLIPGGFDMGAGASVQFLCNLAAGLIIAGLHPLLTLPLGILIGGAIGLFNVFLVIVMRIPSFVGTLGTMFMLQGLTQMYNQGKTLSVGGELGLFGFLAQGYLGLPVIFIVVIILASAMHWFLKHTRTGLRMYASGENPAAAAIRGVRSARYLLIGYVLGGAVLGFTGVMQCAYSYGASPVISGIDFLIQALVAAYLGAAFSKTGSLSIAGSVISAVFIAALSNALLINGISNRQITGILGIFLIISILVTVIRRRDIGQVTIF